MAFTASNKWIINFLMGFCTVGGYLHFMPQTHESSFDLSGKDHIGTAICSDDIRNGARLAIFDLPWRIGITDQAAFLVMFTAMVISIKIWTFFSCCWNYHVQLSNAEKL